MEKYKLTFLRSTNVDKNGNLLKTKDGKPYSRVSIKTAQHGEKYLSGFENAITKNWKVGDEVEIIVTQNGEYLNFATPKKDDVTNEKLEKALNEITKIKLTLEILMDDFRTRTDTKARGYKYPTKEDAGMDANRPAGTTEDEVSLEDLPW